MIPYHNIGVNVPKNRITNPLLFFALTGTTVFAHLWQTSSLAPTDCKPHTLLKLNTRLSLLVSINEFCKKLGALASFYCQKAQAFARKWGQIWIICSTDSAYSSAFQPNKRNKYLKKHTWFRSNFLSDRKTCNSMT
jgi:hypothetical protein